MLVLICVRSLLDKAVPNTNSQNRGTIDSAAYAGYARVPNVLTLPSTPAAVLLVHAQFQPSGGDDELHRGGKPKGIEGDTSPHEQRLRVFLLRRLPPH